MTVSLLLLQGCEEECLNPIRKQVLISFFILKCPSSTKMRLHGTMLLAIAVAIVSINASHDADDEERMFPLKNPFKGKSSKPSSSTPIIEEDPMAQIKKQIVKKFREKPQVAVLLQAEDFESLAKNFNNAMIYQYIQMKYDIRNIVNTICENKYVFDNHKTGLIDALVKYKSPVTATAMKTMLTDFLRMDGTDIKQRAEQFLLEYARAMLNRKGN
ncbi:unnamed protein product [Peronospora destructor]|uniref:RxLR effector protein n=1 Tax=Peronospora destructor TaxID=86335 RepID=A0AAV0T2H6_9STRA|nr:unnamed protein product [Peronospora destructor]